MNANEINNKLQSIYADSFDLLKKVYESKVEGFYNPLFISCPPHYCDDDNKRIMFISLYNLSWFSTQQCNDVEHCMSLYPNFRSELSTELTQRIVKINQYINGKKENNYIYTSILKGYTDIEKDSFYIGDQLFEDIVCDLIRKEIDVLTPDFVFYISDERNALTNYLFEKIFKTNTEIGYNYSINGLNNFIPRYCFKIESVRDNNYEFLDEYLHRIDNRKMDKIHSIHLEQFHSYNDTLIDNLGNLLILVGKNDVGKTSILKALDLAINNPERIDSKSSIIINGIKAINNIKYTFNYHLFNTEIFDMPDIGNKTISKLIHDKVDSIDIQVSIDKIQDEVNNLLKDLNFRDFSTDTIVFLQNYNYYNLIETNNIGQLNTLKSEIKQDLDAYIKRKSDTSIVEQWKVLLNDIKGSDTVPISQRGAGIRRLCSLFVHTIDAYRNSVHNIPTVFAIDEIEISLHPNQQRHLVEILKTLSNDFQIIITTHSPYVVKALGNDNVNNIKILKKIGDNVEVDTMGEKIINYGAGSTYISLNEINYRAFDEASIEYHIELFGYIHERLKEKHRSDSTFEHIWNYDLEKYDKNGNRIKVDTDNDGKSINDIAAVDAWLVNASNESINSYQLDGKYICKWYKYDKKSKIYVEEKKRSLPHCVRNWIDHPLKGNSTDANYNTAYVNNKQYGDDKIIAESISIMEKAIVKNNLNR